MKTPELIDLGSKPQLTAAAPVAEKQSEPKVYYPTLYINNVGEKLDLPDGEFMFMGKGRRMSETERTNADGKTECSCEIEIMSFAPCEDDGEAETEDNQQPESPGYTEDSGDKLDSTMKKISKRKAASSGLMESVPNPTKEVKHTTI